MYRPRSLSNDDTNTCNTHVYISLFQPLIRRKQFGNWPNTYTKRLQKSAKRTLAKRLVGETTVNRLEVWDAAASKVWRDSGRASQQKEALFTGCWKCCWRSLIWKVLCDFMHRPKHYNHKSTLGVRGPPQADGFKHGDFMVDSPSLCPLP